MSNPQIFRIAHRLLICSHCSGNTFIKHLSRDAVLSGWFATFDVIYRCANCGRFEWFHRSAEEKEEILDEADPTFCPACGADIPMNADHCPQCSWAHSLQPSTTVATANINREYEAGNLGKPAMCRMCGGDIPPFQTRCPSCGWSYEDERTTHAMTDEEVEQSTTVVDLSEPALCLECGADIPPFQTRCPSCGWSYEDERDQNSAAPARNQSAASAALGKPTAADHAHPPQARAAPPQQSAAETPSARPAIRVAQCRACGASIPPNKESCPQCGWASTQ